jgi:hypothetical protein
MQHFSCEHYTISIPEPWHYSLFSPASRTMEKKTGQHILPGMVITEGLTKSKYCKKKKNTAYCFIR